MSLLSLVRENPTLTFLILSAFFTLLFKPRSEASYAKIAAFSPRLASLLKLVAALGPDPIKAAKVTGELLSGKTDAAKDLVPVITEALAETLNQSKGDK